MQDQKRNTIMNAQPQIDTEMHNTLHINPKDSKILHLVTIQSRAPAMKNETAAQCSKISAQQLDSVKQPYRQTISNAMAQQSILNTGAHKPHRMTENNKNQLARVRTTTNNHKPHQIKHIAHFPKNALHTPEKILSVPQKP